MYFDSKILSQNSTQESNFELNYESNFESILQHTKSKHQPGIKKEEDKNKNSGQVCFDVVVTLNPSGRVFFLLFLSPLQYEISNLPYKNIDCYRCYRRQREIDHNGIQQTEILRLYAPQYPISLPQEELSPSLPPTYYFENYQIDTPKFF